MNSQQKYYEDHEEENLNTDHSIDTLDVLYTEEELEDLQGWI